MIARCAQSTPMLILFLLASPLTAGEAAPEEIAAIEIRPVDSWHIDHPTHHVQGLAVDDAHFWITSVDRRAREGWIYRVDRASLEVVGQREIALDAQYHPGGMQRRGSRIVVPVAEYRPLSTSTVLVLDAMSLETTASFTVGDHLGAAAIAEDGQIYAANWDARSIYVFDRDGEQVHRQNTPTGVAYQDFEWHEGKLYATGNVKAEEAPGPVVDVIDPQTWKLTARYRLMPRDGDRAQNFAREGLSLWKGSFYLLPEDGPNSTVYRFAIPQD